MLEGNVEELFTGDPIEARNVEFAESLFRRVSVGGDSEGIPLNALEGALDNDVLPEVALEVLSPSYS